MDACITDVRGRYRTLDGVVFRLAQSQGDCSLRIRWQSKVHSTTVSFVEKDKKFAADIVGPWCCYERQLLRACFVADPWSPIVEVDGSFYEIGIIQLKPLPCQCFIAHLKYESPSIYQNSAFHLDQLLEQPPLSAASSSCFRYPIPTIPRVQKIAQHLRVCVLTENPILTDCQRQQSFVVICAAETGGSCLRSRFVALEQRNVPRATRVLLCELSGVGGKDKLVEECHGAGLVESQVAKQVFNLPNIIRVDEIVVAQVVWQAAGGHQTIKRRSRVVGRFQHMLQDLLELGH